MYYTISAISKQIKAKLSNLYPSNEIDSFIFIIYEAVLNISSAQVLGYPEREIEIIKKDEIMQIVKRLEHFEPIQYILGLADFYDLKLNVAPGVLIPRPETEELVHWILKDHVQNDLQVLDIGTGSGAIPIALAKNRKTWVTHAIDISPAALAMAKENASRNETPITFHAMDVLNDPSIFEPCSFDIIVSNPPYVTHAEKKLMHGNVLDYEPHLALFVDDNNPLVFYDCIAAHASNWLNENGCLYFEINEQYGNETIALVKQHGFTQAELRHDLNGKHRMIKARK